MCDSRFPFTARTYTYTVVGKTMAEALANLIDFMEENCLMRDPDIRIIEVHERDDLDLSPCTTNGYSCTITTQTEIKS